MSDVVINVENVSKLYRLGKIGTGTFTHDLNRWWHLVRGKEDPYLKIGEVNDRSKKGSSDYVWALRNISFEIKQGEVVGIIGKNGAGKSTLLKILSRTTTPTAGSIKIKGRVASLLEVGTGFHPELTGRENIFLNGAILGMRKWELQKKFDEIVNFSGVEKYIDTPVKRYSSGMYVRLAFAVAAHLEPEILIVDEVLAVGDAEFQKKALGKMQDVSKGEGRSVLFVSHNMAAIRQLCFSGILLNNGTVVKEGKIEDIIRYYFQREHEILIRPLINDFRTYDITNSPVVIEDIFIKGNERWFPTLPLGVDPEVVIKLNCKTKINKANITISFYNAEGVNLGIAFSWDDNFYLETEEGGYLVHFKLNKNHFTPGDYFIGVGINQSTNTRAWDGINFYPIFKVENQSNLKYFTHRSWGINHFVENSWLLEKI